MRDVSAPGQPINVARVDDEDASHASAARSGSLDTLSAGQGARVTNRRNASEAADRARANAERRFESRHGHGSQPAIEPRRIVIVVVAAMLVLLAIFGIVKCATGGSSTDTSTSTDQSASSSSSSSSVVVPDGGVSYNGTVFTLSQQQDGTWIVVANKGASNEATVFGVDGTPFSLLIYNNVLVVPENNADGTWDVAAYMLGSDSLPTLVTSSDGKTPVSGSGEVTAAVLNGSTLHVTDSSGASTDIALE